MTNLQSIKRRFQKFCQPTGMQLRITGAQESELNAIVDDLREYYPGRRDRENNRHILFVPNPLNALGTIWAITFDGAYIAIITRADNAARPAWALDRAGKIRAESLRGRAFATLVPDEQAWLQRKFPAIFEKYRAMQKEPIVIGC